MAKTERLEDLAGEILAAVGGKENVSSLTHCVTRLRFVVKDQSKVKEEVLDKLEGIIGVRKQNGQIQVVVGQNVNEVYQAVASLSGQAISARIEENLDGDLGRKKPLLDTIFNTISGCITPLISMFIAVGMLKVVLVILSPIVLGVIDESSSTYQFLNFVSDAGFYFLPVFVAATAAQAFKTNMAMSILLGAMLIYPSFITMVNEGVSMNIFGIPVTGNSYSYSILPVIIIVWIMSIVYKQLSRIIPKAMTTLLVPLCTLLIMIPIAFCVVGPLGVFLGSWLADFFNWLYAATGGFSVAIFAACIPLMILTGTSGAVLPIAFLMMAERGYEIFIFFPSIIYNFAIGMIVFSMWLKQRKPEMLITTITAIFGGISEPSLYGYILKSKKALACLMIGLFAGGLYCGMVGVKTYNFSSTSIFGIVGTIGAESSIIQAIIALVIGVAVAFGLTFVLGVNKEIGE